PNDWEALVQSLDEFRVYPVSPYPESTSWHNAWVLRTDKALGLRQGKHASSSSDLYRKRFYSAGAVAAERTILNLVAQLTEVNHEITEGLEALSSLSPNDISQSTVVGSYWRFEQVPRAELRAWAQKIKHAASQPSQEPENYLIWGPSGEGKTFFAKQV